MKVDATFNQLHQDCLVEAGGHITIKADGTPIFRFNSKKAYQKYLKLIQNKKMTA